MRRFPNQEQDMSEPPFPHEEPPPRRNRTRLLAGALTAAAVLIGALASALVVTDEPPAETPAGEVAAETSASPQPTEPSPTETGGLPEDFVCADLDLSGFETFADGPVNDEWAASDAYDEYLDMIGSGLFCKYLVGWPADADNVMLRLSAATGSDWDAGLDEEDWATSDLESYGFGTVTAYQGPEGDGAYLEFADDPGYVKVNLQRGDTALSGSIERVPATATTGEAVDLIIELLDGLYDLHALHYPED
jgi:hypothetical protein